MDLGKEKRLSHHYYKILDIHITPTLCPNLSIEEEEQKSDKDEKTEDCAINDAYTP